MSCLDTFCISHFEEREEYSRMTEKGLELDKVDFAVNGYEVDEEKYPRHGSKDASSSGRGKMKMDDVMTVDLSEEESDDDDDDLLARRISQLNLFPWNQAKMRTKKHIQKGNQSL
jgi:hypothetical protein